MKGIFLLCLLLSIANKVFSQADTTAPGTSLKNDYLERSQTQKTFAWILVGVGTTMVVTGVIKVRNSIDIENPGPDKAANGGALILGGLVSSLASIPFFIAGAKNKGKSLSVSFKNELAPQLRQSSIVQTALPSVSLVIRF